MSHMLSLQAYLARLPLQMTRGRVQIAAALLGAAFAYRGFTRLDVSNRTFVNFDETAGWLGLALLCLAVLVWDGARPHPATWPARLAGFLRRQWWELALVLAIVGFAVFMFTFRFGEFPPSDFLCCEEHAEGDFGYQILQGGHPVDYPLVYYPVALGFRLFGENTVGLRFPLLLSGVLMVPVFYLLLRELVRVPAALFGTVVLASSWPLTLLTNGSQTSYLGTVLFAYLLVLGIRRRNTLALMGAGFVAGVLSYEWGAFKVPTIVGGGFLAALVAYRLVYPLPEGARAFLERVRSLVRTNWRSAVALGGAAMIAVTPLFVAAVQGESRYFARVEEAVSVREQTGTPGFIASNWEDQLRTAAKLFTRFGGEDVLYGARLVDPLTGTLVFLGVVLGVVTFWRPFRLFFLAWYLSLIVGGALILFGFTTWRFFGVIPAAVVLATFVVDDVGRVARRWARGPVVYLFPLLLLVGAIYVAYWNANTLFGTVANEPSVLRKYETVTSAQYALCNYVRGRGAESSFYTFNEASPGMGFAQPHETPEQQRAAWRHFLWVCHDLRAQALASPAEVWPLRDIPAGPVTWAFIIASADTEELVASLGRAIPSKMEPDRMITGPGGVMDLVAYELSGQEVKALQGLYGEYRSGEGEALLAERVDDVRDIQWDAQSGPPPPFTVQWRGLIYVPQARGAALTARTADPTLIRVDGQVSYSSLEEQAASFPQDLLPGWHPVEISVHKETVGGSFVLEWVGPEGLASSVARQDLFALTSLAGWTHERTVERDGELMRTQRFDFAPYYSSAGVIALGIERSGGDLPAVTGERWSTVWHVRGGREYQLKLQVRSGAATVKLDGATVLTVEAGENTRGTAEAEAVLSVSAGDHRLEIQQQHDGGAWTGASLAILVPDVPDYAPEFSAY